MCACIIYVCTCMYTVKPPIKDTLKEDKPPNKGQAESTLVYRKSPLREDNLATRDKTACPKKCLYSEAPLYMHINHT